MHICSFFIIYFTCLTSCTCLLLYPQYHLKCEISENCEWEKTDIYDYEIKVLGVSNEKTLKLKKSGLSDWVIWNPYETAAKMSDMHENGHLEFVCVEATQASDRIVIKPGEDWQAKHSMEIS